MMASYFKEHIKVDAITQSHLKECDIVEAMKQSHFKEYDIVNANTHSYFKECNNVGAMPQYPYPANIPKCNSPKFNKEDSFKSAAAHLSSLS